MGVGGRTAGRGTLLLFLQGRDEGLVHLQGTELSRGGGCVLCEWNSYCSSTERSWPPNVICSAWKYHVCVL